MVVRPGSGWPGDCATRRTAVAHDAAEVRRLAGSVSALSELSARISVCRACPRLVAWREEVASTKRRAFADQEYWGRPVPGFGVDRPAVVIVGSSPSSARSQPDRAQLHRRSLRPVALRSAVSMWARQPAHGSGGRRRASTGRHPNRRERPLRPSREPAHARGAGRVPPVAGARVASRLAPRAGRGRARRIRLGKPVARLAHGRCPGARPSTALRARSRGTGRRCAPCSAAITSASRTPSPDG